MRPPRSNKPFYPQYIRSLLAKNASCAVLTRKNIVIFQNNTMQLDDKSFITN